MQRSYEDTLAQLSARSVTKHFDAYVDVDWNHPAHRIEHDDPRFELDEDEPLEATTWYRSQPQAVRARIGLHMMAAKMKTGIDFEAILSRGLLEFAGTLPNGSPEFRYAYHEVIEEAQHSLMFQEFVNRTHLPVPGLRGLEAFGGRRTVPLGRTRPELFFVHVLAGEWPIDHVQRRALARERELHPLLRRIMQIHVIEEARHLCFASRWLEEHVPRLGVWRLAMLRLHAPFILAGTSMTMMKIPQTVIDTYGIPREVVQAAHAHPRNGQRIREGLAPVVSLARKLGILTAATAPLWRWLGVIDHGVPQPHLLGSGQPV